MTTLIAANVFDVAQKTAGLLVTAIGIVGAVVSFTRWRNRPQFVCGVLPLEEELARAEFDPSRLGRQSLSKAFRFRQQYFAVRLRRPDIEELPDQFRRRIRGGLSCRRVS